MRGLPLWVRAEWRRRGAALLALALLVALAGGVATALYAGARRADTAFARFREVTAPYNLVASLRLGEEKPSADELSERRGRPAPRHRGRRGRGRCGVGQRGVVVGDPRLPRDRPRNGRTVRHRDVCHVRPAPLTRGDRGCTSVSRRRQRGDRQRRRRAYAWLDCRVAADVPDGVSGSAARMGQQRCNAGLRGRPRRTGDRGRGRRRGPRRVRRRRRPLSGDPFSRGLRPGPRRRDRPPRAERDDPR